MQPDKLSKFYSLTIDIIILYFSIMDDRTEVISAFGLAKSGGSVSVWQRNC
jgi:hypothetical protein